MNTNTKTKSKVVNPEKAMEAKNKLIAELKEVEGSIKDTTILDRIAYTLTKGAKNLASVSVNTLNELLRDAKESLKAKKPVEAALKKDLKKKPAVKEEKAEDTKDEEKEPETETSPPEEKPKSKLKSKLKKDTDKPKKEDPKEDDTEGEPTEDETPKGKPKANKKKDEDKTAPVHDFKDEYEIEGIGKIVKVEDQTAFSTFEAFEQAIEDERTMYILYGWTQRMIKTAMASGEYDPNGVLKAPINKLPNNMDVVQLAYIAGEYNFAYGISTYTEVLYFVQKIDLEMLDDNTRVSNGLDFMVYELVAEKPEKATKK